ncbi:alpha/beta hydrolase fold family protein, partial [Vibrio parahaemolyticus AQ3810]
ICLFEKQRSCAKKSLNAGLFLPRM